MDEGELFSDILPRVKDFKDTIVVIKAGGHAMVDPVSRSAIMKDVVTLATLGVMPVVVHGGGPEIDGMMKRMGKKPEFVAGLRVTDDESLEIVRMVLVGNVCTDLVTLIMKHGGKGVGLLGNDGCLIMARRKPVEMVLVDGKQTQVDYGWVGETVEINPEIVFHMIANGFIPVISPIGYDSEGKCLNLNADTVAGDVAIALRAKALLMLTDVDGVMMDPTQKDTLISKLTIQECSDLIKIGVISKGMIPKITSACAVVESGIESVRILNGNKKNAILYELLTEKGAGTSILQ
jgi:acetylglutamate kinase